MQKDYFHIHDVEPQELMQLLLIHFSNSTSIKTFVHKFYHATSQHYIEISFDESGAIKRVALSKNFPTAEQKEIGKKIQDSLLTKHPRRVAQIICFCNSKVTEGFRYKDLFQILPLPEDAENVNARTGIMDHPFILEVAYEGCPIPVIDAMRRMKKIAIYTRLLNLLANQHIFARSQYARFAWALTIEDTTNIYSRWSQLEYIYNGLKAPKDGFSSIDHLNTIKRVSFQTYYGTPRVTTLSSLTFPDNIEQSLDKALSLDKNNWKNFFMACSWYAQYINTLQESHSSAFIALVTALECLVQEKESCEDCKQVLLESEDICTSCGQPRYYVTRHFKEFLKIHFPAIDQFPREKKTIYDVRSKLAHGMDLLQADLEPWNFLMDAKMQEQDQLQRNLYFIAGITIYNWLQTIVVK